jgi:hypothetical protein
LHWEIFANLNLNLTVPSGHIQHTDYFGCYKNPGENDTICSSIEIITENGFCHSFNIRNYNEIFKGNFSLNFDNFGEIVKAGKENRFTFRTINYSEDFGNENNFCSNIGYGVKAIFHHPNEFPTNIHESQYLNLGSTLRSFVSGISYKTNENLRKFKPNIRNCYFENERELKFFTNYTKNNCDFECMTNFTLKTCGCVHFSMPRTKNIRICGLKDGNCYFNAINFWMQNSSTKFPCDCFPSCNYVKYSIKTSYSVTSEKSTMYLSEYRTIFNLRVEDSMIEEQENYAVYNLENFIADLGGIIGLFLGFSILSLIELIFEICESLFKYLKSR